MALPPQDGEHPPPVIAISQDAIFVMLIPPL